VVQAGLPASDETRSRLSRPRQRRTCRKPTIKTTETLQTRRKSPPAILAPLALPHRSSILLLHQHQTDHTPDYLPVRSHSTHTLPIQGFVMLREQTPPRCPAPPAHQSLLGSFRRRCKESRFRWWCSVQKENKAARGQEGEGGAVNGEAENGLAKHLVSPLRNQVPT
jgi:hypothetical protein